MIRTRYRMKVPRDTVTFLADAGDVRDRLAADRPARAVRATYEGRPPGMSTPTEWIARGDYEPHWELTVYAVPRHARAAVREALVSAGLAAIRDWLAAARTPAWLAGGHSRTVPARPDDGTLTLEDEDR